MKIPLLPSILLAMLAVVAADAQLSPPLQASSGARVAKEDITIAFLTREFTARGFECSDAKENSFRIFEEAPGFIASFVSQVFFDKSTPLRIHFRARFVVRKDRPLQKKLELVNRLNEKCVANVYLEANGEALAGDYVYLLPEKVDLDHLFTSLRYFRNGFLSAPNLNMDLDGLIFGTKVYGVGLVLMAPPTGSDYVLISSVDRDTPAAAAGIQPKSKLVFLDGVSLKGQTVEAIQAAIRNESSPSIKLTVQGPNDVKPIEYSLRKVWQLAADAADPSAAKAGTPKIQWIKGELYAANTRAKAEKKPLVVYFGQAGNVNCKKVEDHTFSDESVQRLADRAIWAWIYPEKDEDEKGNVAKLVKDLGVQQYPAVTVLSNSSNTMKEIGRINSGFEPHELSKKLVQAFDEAGKDVKP